jgi:sugar O-acyltransferase (sialic acid O-acetyltransferase NeuD family)
MKLAIFGYGGCAREVASQIKQPTIFFVDDEYANDVAKPISKFDPLKYEIIVAVADSKSRREIVNKLPKETKYFTFIHPTAQILDDYSITIGEGCFIGINSILTTNIKLGNHAILNRGNHIGHDCKIGDFCSMMPGSIISGDVEIQNQFYIGTNSSVREKIRICNNVKVGLNSGVVKDINISGTYIGLPAKIKKNNLIQEKES